MNLRKKQINYRNTSETLNGLFEEYRVHSIMFIAAIFIGVLTLITGVFDLFQFQNTIDYANNIVASLFVSCATILTNSIANLVFLSHKKSPAGHLFAWSSLILTVIIMSICFFKMCGYLDIVEEKNLEYIYITLRDDTFLSEVNVSISKDFHCKIIFLVIGKMFSALFQSISTIICKRMFTDTTKDAIRHYEDSQKERDVAHNKQRIERKNSVNIH